MKKFLSRYLNHLRHHKFSMDLIWNYGAFFTMAISGLLINSIIASRYNANVLGQFNLVLAVYIIFSQLNTAGIHFSMMRSIALQDFPREKEPLILSSGLFLIVGTNLVGGGLLVLFREQISACFHYEKFQEAILFIVPAITLFSLNKIILAYLNGKRMMKAFSCGQMIRYLSMIIFIGVGAIQKWDPVFLNLNYLFAESMVFLGLSFILIQKKLSIASRIDLFWLKKHFLFGTKSFLTGVFVDLNTRVDVLILGLFVSAETVGIYSFVAMLVEGLFQFLGVLTNNINPLLAYHLHRNEYAEITALIKKLRWIFYPLMGGLIGLLLGIYPFFVSHILANPVFLKGYFTLFILLMGVWLTTGFAPFFNLLLQAGHPSLQTLHSFCVVVTNVVLNFCLIPTFGLLGCAIATSMATFVLPVFYLYGFCKKAIRYDIVWLK